MIALDPGTTHTASQMPFGFWVLGNVDHGHLPNAEIRQVSNAFRLLGSGELAKSRFDL